MTAQAALAHPDVARLAEALRRSRGQEIEAVPPMRWAAIALVIRIGASGEPELLMIKRAEHELDPWSGHVACPGGRMDPGDHDLAATAVRETWEETGIDVTASGRLLGTLDDLTPRTPSLPPLVIRPFVAIVSASVVIVPSPEVAAAFWVPLSALRERASWGLGTVHVRGTPREVDTFTHGEHLVWGLTERVLRQFLERIG